MTLIIPCNLQSFLIKPSSKRHYDEETRWKELRGLGGKNSISCKCELLTNLKSGVEGAKSKLLWQLRRIKEVLIGRGNNVKACIIKASQRLFRRPIHTLYPLELNYA
ncbi:hypothetical protein TNCT_553891 [Trichonephila clavata]|uniref:Uncharacterized protein n=1 Tax=Trichonephila clavata TaxID=2740835 RepID=A0A8X6J7X8_TRICU|nr:hypothetical protein TNCT_553891 [Trichonephila clavata]